MRQTISNSAQKIADFKQALFSLKTFFDSGVVIRMAFVSARTLEEVEKLGARCFDVGPANFTDWCFALQSKWNIRSFSTPSKWAFSRPKYLPGTRKDILVSVTEWLTTPSEGQNIIWLYGLAGTLSATVAEYFYKLGQLGAFIFFDRNDPTHSDPNTVICTLAHQLSLCDCQASFCLPFFLSQAMRNLTSLQCLGFSLTCCSGSSASRRTQNTEDIHMFLRNQMDTIRQHHRMYDLASDWPGGPVLRDARLVSSDQFHPGRSHPQE